MNNNHKATNKNYRDNYDRIFREEYPANEHDMCDECGMCIPCGHCADSGCGTETIK